MLLNGGIEIPTKWKLEEIFEITESLVKFYWLMDDIGGWEPKTMCDDCLNGVHKHMSNDIPKDYVYKNRAEYLDSIDCKNTFQVNGHTEQCVCEEWQREYKRTMESDINGE